MSPDDQAVMRAIVREEVAVVREEVAVVRGEVAVVREEVAVVRTEITAVEQRSIERQDRAVEALTGNLTDLRQELVSRLERMDLRIARTENNTTALLKLPA